MSKYNQYLETINAASDLNSKVEALKTHPDVKKVIDFRKKLQTLMTKHGVSASEVISLLDGDRPATPSKAPARKKAAKNDKRRASRPMKTYVNPHTGETVKTKGGNHKTLNEWRAEHGKETVASWVQE